MNHEPQTTHTHGQGFLHGKLKAKQAAQPSSTLMMRRGSWAAWSAAMANASALLPWSRLQKVKALLQCGPGFKDRRCGCGPRRPTRLVNNTTTKRCSNCVSAPCCLDPSLPSTIMVSLAPTCKCSVLRNAKGGEGASPTSADQHFAGLSSIPRRTCHGGCAGPEVHSSAAMPCQAARGASTRMPKAVPAGIVLCIHMQT